jgi:DNA-binding CsgD family transcriptional regulator
MDFESTVTRIYEAAAEPDLWPSVLHELGELVDAAGGIILTRRADSWTGWRCSDLMISRTTDAWMGPGGGAGRTKATSRLIAFDRAGFVAENEGFTEQEWLEDSVMSEWCGPLGLHHCAATAIPVPTGDLVLVQLNRRKGKRPFDQSDIARLDGFRPHLARAGLLAARWRLERLRAAAQALAIIGLPAAVLDASGRVVAANELIEAMRPHISWLPKDRIALLDPAADGMLNRAVTGMAFPTAASARSFPSKGAGGDPAVVHLIPISGAARDLFGGGLSLITVTPVAAPAAPDAALIQGLFDLTPAEARVARAVTQQKTVEEIASEFDVSRETVRTQIKSLLAKTGCARQLDLAMLLAQTTQGQPRQTRLTENSRAHLNAGR